MKKKNEITRLSPFRVRFVWSFTSMLTISIHEAKATVTAAEITHSAGDVKKHRPNEYFAVFINALCKVKARQHFNYKVVKYAYLNYTVLYLPGMLQMLWF